MHRGSGIKLFLIILLTFVCGASSISASQPADSWRPSPTGAALRSMILPGWGEWYAGQPQKSVIVGGLATGFGFAIYKQHNLYKHYKAIGDDGAESFYRNDRNRMTWYLAGTIILSMMDAFVDAHLYNFDVSESLDSGVDIKLNENKIIIGLEIQF